MASYWFFIMYTTMVVRRKPPTQQPGAWIRGSTSMHRSLIVASIELRPNNLVNKRWCPWKKPYSAIRNYGYLLLHDLSLVCSIVCDSNKAFHDCPGRKIVSSSHLSNWRNVSRDILVWWFVPKLLKSKIHPHKTKSNSAKDIKYGWQKTNV